MTAILTTEACASVREARVRYPSGALTGTGTLVRFILRRERFKLPSWMLGMTVLLYLSLSGVSEIAKTGRLVTVEENPRLCGWGAEIASIAADECFWSLDGPILRITTPHVPLPSADKLEDATIPSVERIVREIREKID